MSESIMSPGVQAGLMQADIATVALNTATIAMTRIADHVVACDRRQTEIQMAVGSLNTRIDSIQRAILGALATSLVTMATLGIQLLMKLHL